MKTINTRKSDLVSLDIVAPVYNEVDVIPSLLLRLQETFSVANCSKYGISRVTLLFVDDGSTDLSSQLLADQLQSLKELPSKIVVLSRNFGHQAAVSAGVKLSSADIVAIIDADLQDPPELILQMIEKWREGFDVIYAKRVKRKEGLFKRFSYWLFYRLYHFLSPIDVAIDAGDFCLMSHRVVLEINKLPESIRFPRGLRSWVGFTQGSISYDRPERVAGKTKYSFKRLYQLATDGITSISLVPLKLAQAFSILYFSISFLVAFYILVFKTISLNDISFIILFVVLISNALIMFCLYILGAYVGRGYMETKGRPNHIIKEIVDLQDFDKF